MTFALLAALALAVGAESPAPFEDSAKDANAPAELQLHGEPVLEIAASEGAASPADRARAAEAVLGQLLDAAQASGAPADVTAVHLPASADAVPATPEAWSLRLDDHEFLRLGSGDVAHAGMPADVFLESAVSRAQAVVNHQRHRISLQATLQSISMTLFLGLLAFLALRALSVKGKGARQVIEERLSRLRGLRLRDVEIVSPEALEGTSYALVGIGRIVLQIGLVYGYLAYALSQFATTRGWVAPMTAALTSPFIELIVRIGRLAPGLVLLVAGALSLAGALRLTGFLLRRVATGEFQWAWLPRDQVSVVLPLLRAGIALAAAIGFVGLVSSGNGLLAHLLTWLVFALALAAVPALAAAGVGTLALFGRRYQVGQWVAIGRHVGEVTHVGFFDLTLVPAEAGLIRIPHLITLWTPVRHLNHPPRASIPKPVSSTE